MTSAMNRTVRAAAIGIVSIALLVSLAGVLPAVAHKPPAPKCTVVAVPVHIAKGATTSLVITLINAPHSVTLSVRVTVYYEGTLYPSANSSSIATNSSGKGTTTMTYPTNFPSSATTMRLGSYLAKVTVSGDSSTASCSAVFRVV